jgi:hypothetical protein
VTVQIWARRHIVVRLKFIGENIVFIMGFCSVMICWILTEIIYVSSVKVNKFDRLIEGETMSNWVHAIF